MKHTPLPWHMPHGDSPYWENKSGISIAGKNGFEVCRVTYRHGLTMAESKANTEFIVKACNSYYKLSKALENIINATWGYWGAGTEEEFQQSGIAKSLKQAEKILREVTE